MGRSAASEDPSRTPSTAPGVDGEADPDRIFTEARLKAALLPAEAFGERVKVTATDLAPFGPYGHGDWGGCEPAEDLLEELNGFDGASAMQTVRFGPVTEDAQVITVQLVSMPAARAVRYFEIQRRLREICPEVTVDTEAAPVQEHHETQEIAALGDEAMLDILRVTGGDEYDGSPSYAVDVRVGGVLAMVKAGADRGTAISLAARATQRIRAELYGTDG
ncbi:hypothetical protein E0500_014695 [Streptomyces sp. KM273126]|uniref:hypothetical protein n=1 Tax=Streptomyces sp. KM273126 TaxID=2545247 RepID=UPI00103CB0E6|nr:hypothetical protein [Streptomyces sp. KM273126]MBA2808611.1 hypothetical protein [Streptomyces sp. KM273126]